MEKKFQNLKLEPIAKRVGVSPSHVHYILTGKRNPTLPVAKRLASAIGVTLDQLAAHIERAAAA
jgi:transcriptional regulator with XRE-family HTH domain